MVSASGRDKGEEEWVVGMVVEYHGGGALAIVVWKRITLYPISVVRREVIYLEMKTKVWTTALWWSIMGDMCNL